MSDKIDVVSITRKAEIVARELIQGPPGPAADPAALTALGNRITVLESTASYVHVQNSSSVSWVATHNLGRYPAVTVVDSADTEVEGDVVHTNINVTTISFSAAFSGKAFFS